jgi:hypothetical protein
LANAFSSSGNQVSSDFDNAGPTGRFSLFDGCADILALDL